MGPKLKSSGDSKKVEQKKQERVIEDKTFGLKNKNKSIKVQSFIKGVVATVKGAGAGKGGMSAELQKEFQEKADKKKQREEESFLNSLYKQVKAVSQIVLEEGEESKYALCAFFKAGHCEKGDECEFSHDLNIQFNQGAFDIYTDLRDAKKKILRTLK